MSMFCYQCQETAKGTGCEIRGVCGKTEEVAKLQDLLIYALKGISEIVVKGRLDVKELGQVNHEVLNMSILATSGHDSCIIRASIP